MHQQHKLLLIIMILFALMAATLPSMAAVPSINWTAPEPAPQWYQIVIEDSNTFTVLNEWVDAQEESLCESGNCTFEPGTMMPFGLDTGSYDVTINYWDADASQILLVEAQQLTVADAETTVTTPGGRISVTIPDNTLFDWVNIWIGDATTFAPVPDLNTPAAGWYEKANDLTCDAGSCTVLTAAHAANGNYLVYLRYYDIETNTMGAWSGSFDFSLNLAQPAAVTTSSGSADDENKPILQWNGSDLITWYRVWLGSGNTTVDTWVQASDLGCSGGGTCEFTSETQLNGGRTYSWYVYGWGPGGFTTGGLNNSGWAEGQAFTVAGSGNAFLMNGGLTVIEVESAPVAGDWSARTAVSGYTGSSYYEWRHGNTGTGTAGSGQGILSYPIRIPAAGTYRFQLRSHSPDPLGDYNDLYARIQGEGSTANAVDPSPEGTNTDFVNMENTWFKVYMNTVDDWSWDARHVDNDPHEIFFIFDAPGEYTVEFSGRSNQFKPDRFVIYDPELVTQEDATDITNPESPRG